jgi:hypothetical protein
MGLESYPEYLTVPSELLVRWQEPWSPLLWLRPVVQVSYTPLSPESLFQLTLALAEHKMPVTILTPQRARGRGTKRKLA